MLFVANLPVSFTEEQFNALVQSLGKVEHSFLVRCESGISKGYGIVKFVTMYQHQSEQIERKLRAISGHNLLCKFADTCSPLQSKCLLIENLPANFPGMCEFRRVCSAIAKPTFCQLGLKQGFVQNWGLVEYEDWKDAEKSQEQLIWNTFQGRGVSVKCCMPGVSAFSVMQSLTKPELRQPSGTEVSEYLNKMLKHNNQFAQEIYQVCSSALQEEKFHVEAIDAKRSSGALQVTSSPMSWSSNVHPSGLPPPGSSNPPPWPYVLPPTPIFLCPVPQMFSCMTNVQLSPPEYFPSAFLDLPFRPKEVSRRSSRDMRINFKPCPTPAFQIQHNRLNQTPFSATIQPLVIFHPFLEQPVFYSSNVNDPNIMRQEDIRGNRHTPIPPFTSPPTPLRSSSPSEQEVDANEPRSTSPSEKDVDANESQPNNLDH